MSELTAVPSITSLPLGEIAINTRIRPVSEATVQGLMHVIEVFGFTTPIVVRKKKAGFELIDGANRLEALRRLGSANAPVAVFTCTDDAAQAAEASQNLAGAGMSPLDDALFLAAYQDAYQKLYPESVRGMAGAIARHEGANDTLSFAAVVAEKRSMSTRQVQRIATVGRSLDRTLVAQLRSAPNKLTMTDLKDIGKITDDAERAQVVLKLSTGQAKKVSQARALYAAEKGETATPKDPVEEGFKALLNAWSRAPAAARRRFVDEERAALSALLDGGAE
jgi:ParB family transcriptional regulator, chromosome partitioning protein